MMISAALKNAGVAIDRSTLTSRRRFAHSLSKIITGKSYEDAQPKKIGFDIIRHCSTEKHPKFYEALVYTPSTRDLSLLRLPFPCLDEDEVLVRVAYAGICGTDLQVLGGKFPCKATPIVLGHEISGVVTKVGTCVRNVSPGDKVAINPNNICNTCEYCLKGIPNFCENEGLKTGMGYFKDGGWAEYCIASSNLVMRLPESIGLKHAVLSEPLSCITHALDLIQPIPIHTRILISGAGIAGTLMATLLRYQGYPNVTICEANYRRLDLAKTNFCPVGYQIIRPQNLKACLESQETDIAIDCTGNTTAIETAISLLRPGGKMLIYGVGLATDHLILSPIQIFLKELKLFGSMINPFTFPRAVSWVETLGNKFLNFNDMGVRIYSLADYCQALKALENKEIIKAVFEFNYMEDNCERY